MVDVQGAAILLCALYSAPGQSVIRLLIKRCGAGALNHPLADPKCVDEETCNIYTYIYVNTPSVWPLRVCRLAGIVGPCQQQMRPSRQTNRQATKETAGVSRIR